TTAACPFCNTGCATASGLFRHSERNSCSRAPNLNRETILCMIRDHDPHGIITNKQVEWDKENKSQLLGNRACVNSFNWKCSMCHSMFNTIKALNSHLNSPIHKQKVYHCPNSKRKCRRQLVNLAGLFS
ncbi:hypothetical protein B0J12DRAFT_571509, partial [Macrophomina phaseolina]